METTNLRVRSFDRVARKYGVDYAIHRDKSVSPPKYVIFFKGRDSEAINAAFTEYSAGQIQRESKPRTSVLARLQQFKALVQSIGKERVREKQQAQARLIFLSLVSENMLGLMAVHIPTTKNR